MIKSTSCGKHICIDCRH